LSSLHLTVGHLAPLSFFPYTSLSDLVTVRLEIDPERFAERAGARLGALGRRVKGDLRRFKTVVESGGARGTGGRSGRVRRTAPRSEEHTSELQSRENLVCRLPPEKKQ